MTGGTSGLGWRFTQVLANAGAIVVSTGRRKERLEEIARLVESEGGHAHPVVMDTTSAESIVEGVAAAEEGMWNGHHRCQQRWSARRPACTQNVDRTHRHSARYECAGPVDPCL